jgi:hypothetical protein
MTINKLVEQFLAERPRNEDIAKYFAIAANIGFNEAIDIVHSLACECPSIDLEDILPVKISELKKGL